MKNDPSMSSAQPPIVGAGPRALGVPDGYLAYAAVAPPSSAVKRAVAATLDLYSRGGAAFPVLVAEREALRVNLGRLLGTSAQNLALITGTTAGIRALALSFTWRPGDRVVLFSGEFPANVTPWQRAAELFGLEIRYISLEHAVDDPDSYLRPLERELQAGVRLVAVSAVQFQTGLRMPLARLCELCHRHGAELAVDAIQGCGVIPIDVEALGVDYLVSGAHKWLGGVEGAGFVFCAPERAAALQPRTAGWLSHEDPTGFLLQGPGELRYDRPIRRGIQHLEGSSMASVALAALGAAVSARLEIGLDAIYAHVSRYLDALNAGLLARGLRTLRASEPAARSGILSLVVPKPIAATDLARALAERGVTVSTPEGLVRFAPHYPNPESEVATVLAALDDSLKQLRC